MRVAFLIDGFNLYHSVRDVIDSAVTSTSSSARHVRPTAEDCASPRLSPPEAPLPVVRIAVVDAVEK